MLKIIADDFYHDMNEKYTLLMRIIHWLIGLMIIGLLIAGWTMTSLQKDDQLFHLKYSLFYPMHKGMGMIVLFFLCYRVIVRLNSSIPPLPENLKTVEKFTTKIVHFLLYLLPITIAAAGYIMSSASQKAIDMYFFEVPLLIDFNPQVAKISHCIHIYGVRVLAVLIALHIAGFLKHLIFDKTNLLRRIT